MKGPVAPSRTQPGPAERRSPEGFPRWWRWALLLNGLFVGCGAEFSNALFEQDAAFLAAVPLRQELRLSPLLLDTVEEAREAPLLTRQPLSLGAAGDRSELWRTTRQLTLAIDSGLLGLLAPVSWLVAEPPSTRTATSRSWGPRRHPLDPAAALLDVWQEEGGHAFTLALHGEVAPHESAGWVVVLEGTRQADEASLVLDLDAAWRLGMAESRGQVELHHVVQAGMLREQLLLRQVRWSPAEEPQDLQVDLQRQTTAGAEEVVGDLEWAGWQGEQLLRWRSRWRADGTGRGEVVLQAGNAGPILGRLAECWDAAFTLVYRGEAADGELFTVRGAEADCGLPAAWPERVIPPTREE